MLKEFTPSMVLKYVNVGLAISRHCVDYSLANPRAENMFATGYAMTRMQEGGEALNGFNEHDRRVIKAFAARLFNFDTPGVLLTMPKGREIRLVTGLDNRAFKATGNLLIAQTFTDGYNNRVKLSPGVSLVGKELLTHLEDGATKFELMQPLEPLAVIEAVVSLFYADMWQPNSD